MASESVSTGFQTILTGTSEEAFSASAISCDCAATCLRTSSP